MRFMQRSKDSLAKWLSAILPVVIVGLVGLFAVTVIRDYGKKWPGSLVYVGLRSRMNKEQS